jgi:hypothetical protein
MTYTKTQMQAIKAHYRDSYVAFRFRKDGTVEAKQSPSSPFGVLYTSRQAKSHLEAVGTPNWYGVQPDMRSEPPTE